MPLLALLLAFLLTADAGSIFAQTKEAVSPDHPPALAGFGTFPLGQADSTRLR
jgi:hypothetical protein